MYVHMYTRTYVYALTYLTLIYNVSKSEAMERVGEHAGGSSANQTVHNGGRACVKAAKVTLRCLVCINKE